MSGPRFETTKWSVIVAAAHSTPSPGSREALEQLCSAYWFPVFAFVRRQGYERETALDLTQGYFAGLLEKGLLQAADRERGRFRSFLLATVKQYLSDERKKKAALKRGGGVAFVNLEAAAAEERLHIATGDSESPEAVFERQWAMTVFNRARQRLQAEFADAGKQEQFRLLQGHLSGDSAQRTYAEIASELNTTEGAIKMAVQRIRQRFGRVLREEIAQTIDAGTDLDAEVRHLLSVV